MRKIVYYPNENKIEIEVSDNELTQFLDKISQSKPKKVDVSAPSISSSSNPTIFNFTEPMEQPNPNLTKQKFSTKIQRSKLLFETKTAIKGRPDSKQSVYKLFQDLVTQELIGYVTTSTQKYTINLGNPNKPLSKISIVKKVVNSMPDEKNFTRKDLQKSLPPYFGKADILKFSLDYLEIIAKIIEKVKEKQFQTVSIQYRKVKTVRENSDLKTVPTPKSEIT